MTMDAFKARTREFRLNEPDTYVRNLRGAAIAQNEEQYLFLICAYDYVYNPEDNKVAFIMSHYLRKPSNQANLGVELYWYINIGNSHQEKIDVLLNNPTIKLSFENRSLNAVPPPPGSQGEISKTTGNFTWAARKQLAGGVIWGGVANYNLFTKAIDVACAGYSDLNYICHSLATSIVKNRDSAFPSEHKQRLVERYQAMSLYYTDEALTKFGLIYR
jgi:hypothetical protein